MDVTFGVPEDLSDAELADYLRYWETAKRECAERDEAAGVVAACEALDRGRAEARRRVWHIP